MTTELPSTVNQSEEVGAISQDTPINGIGVLSQEERQRAISPLDINKCVKARLHSAIILK